MNLILYKDKAIHKQVQLSSMKKTEGKRKSGSIQIWWSGKKLFQQSDAEESKYLIQADRTGKPGGGNESEV